jgi:hypothetical protein
MTKICKSKTLDNTQCKAPVVVKKFNPKNGKKYNTDYCQMHQPGKILKSNECSCPKCKFHRKKIITF